MLHLIISYPFSRQVWHEILAWMRMTCTTQPTDPRDISLRLVDESQASHPKSHAQRASLHNLSRTMDDMEAPKRLRIRQSTASISTLVSKIKDEVVAWILAGAKGLRDVVPSTRNVH